MPNTNLQPPKPPAQHRFHLLDALRGIAAVLVVPRHIPLPTGNTFASYSSFLAVDFFFCLSGFIVAFSYEQRLATSFRLKDFAITRMIRLYPLAIMGVLLGVCAGNWNEICAGYHSSHIVVGSFITLFSLMLIPVAHYALFPLDGPMWTLFLELIANFAYALLMRGRLRATWIMLSIAVVSLAALSIIRNRIGSLDFGFSPATLYVGVTRVFLSFFLGVLLFRYQRHRAAGRIHARRALVAAVAIGILLVAVLCNPFLFMRSAPAELLTIAIVLPLIVHFGSRIAVPGSVTPICAWLGTISYPLYMVHKPLLDMMWRMRHPSVPAAPAIYFYLTLLIVPVWLLTRFYDEPVRRALGQTFRIRSMLRSELTSNTSAAATN